MIIGLSFIFVAGQIWSHPFFTWLLGAFVLLAVIFILPRLKGTVLVMILVFFIAGAILLWVNDAQALTWVEAATTNVNLVTLFVFAPLFGIPVRFPEYIRGLTALYTYKMKRKAPFFLGTKLLNHLVAIVMNIGSLPVMYQIASVNHALSSQRLLANALSRGYALAILWSPYFATMVLVTSALDVTWGSLLPYIIGFTLISFMISYLLERSYLHKTDPYKEPEQHIKAPSETKYGKPLTQLALYLVFAIVMIMLLDRVLEWSIIMIICFTAAVYPLLWCVIHRQFTVYKEGFIKHLHTSVPALKREAILFISAGFLSGAVALTSFDRWLYGALNATPLPIAFTFTVCVLVAFFITALIGLHPIVLVAILVTGIDPQMMGISAMYYGVLILGGWACTNMMSPSTAASNLVAHLLHMNVLDVVRYNYKLTAILLVVLPIYLWIVLT